MRVRVAFLVFAVMAVLMCSSAMAGTCTLREGYVIAVSEQAFDRAVSMIVQKDEVAFNKMAAAGLCGITKRGGKVFLVDWGIGKCEVRPEGATSTLWVNTEALDCK